MSLLAALGFLTWLPVPLGGGAPSLERAAKSQAWFPVVGLLIGALLVGLDQLLGRGLPRGSADVLLVIALVWVTGGLHLDGLGDSADGIAGGRDREERLRIMRDPHAGSFAVIAIVSVLAMKWAGLQALPGAVRWQALLLTPCLARMAMTLSLYAVPPARDEGLAHAFRAHADLRSAGIAAATGVVAAVVVFGLGGLAAVALAGGAGAAIGVVARRSVGGLTGDLCGATVEITEASVLLFIAALARQGWLTPAFM